MNKEIYLKELRNKLKRLPMDEVEAALAYYHEYFDEAGEENVDKVIRELGTPSHVATQILADYAVKELNEHPESTKKSISAIWFILLAILASPIALPLIIFVFSMVFALVMLCGAFALTFFSLIIALILTGVASIIAGFAVIVQHWQTALFFIGGGLVASGVGLLLISPFTFIVKHTSMALAKWLKKLFVKMTRKQKVGV